MTDALQFPPNTSFSPQVPGLQLFVDSTSLGEFKKCPRSYFYSIVMGYQSKRTSVHLEFGIWLHGAIERYWHARFAPEASHDQAMSAAVRWALEQTWNPELRRGWISDHPQKNRVSLIRSIVWYLDEVARDDVLETVRLANGKPAVELSFCFGTGLRTQVSAESISFCGHLDRMASMNGSVYIPDIKTTTAQLAPSYFSKYTPDNQVSFYTFSGQVAFEQKIEGMIIDAIQVGGTFSRFQRGPVLRSQSSVDEWFHGTAKWLRQMESCAEEQHWPQNDKACDLFGGCQFREICGKSPGSRQTWLDTGFKRRIWDPMQKRGEV